MAVNSKHPEYATRLPDWDLMSNAHQGERKIKEKGTEYLPATSGMIADGQGLGKAEAPGQKAYDAYNKRARFPDCV